MRRHRTTSIIVFNKEGQVFLQKRDDKPLVKEAGKWDFWGGHCEEGETPEACAARELEEEISIKVTDPSKLSFISKRRYGNKEEFVFAYLFEGQRTPQVFEGERGKWVSVEDARKLPMAFGAELLLREEMMEKARLGLREIVL